MAKIGTDIDFAIELLNNSELVGIPTETVYGLAGNALNPKAVAEIFKVKNRPSFDPLILHTSSLERVPEFVQEIPAIAYELANHFWPGPLTMIFKKQEIIPYLVTSGLDTIAVRIPNHPLSIELLENIDFPLAAPSANPFGYVSPTNAEHVNEQLGEKIKYVLDGGDCHIGIESTIVEFENDEINVLRLGGCTVEEIEKIAGRVHLRQIISANPVAPGMMNSHYSPSTPITIGGIDELIVRNSNNKIGILAFKKDYKNINKDHQFILSEKGDLSEAATRLFTGLRYLDTLNLQLIISEYVPDRGLGRAINDRLKRAEAKRK